MYMKDIARSGFSNDRFAINDCTLRELSLTEANMVAGGVEDAFKTSWTFTITVTSVTTTLIPTTEETVTTVRTVETVA